MQAPPAVATVPTQAPIAPATAAAGLASMVQQKQYPNSSLYVGDLHPATTENELFQHFRETGNVVSVRICRHAVTRQSLGYGYVNYATADEAKAAINELNYSEINKVPCRIMWSQRDPSSRKSGANNIFVKNLDKSIDQQQLHDTFEQFGTVLSSKIGTDAAGESKGFGFVHFEDKEAADLAIAKVNGMVMKNKKVYVGRFMPKKDRDAELQQIRANFTNVYVKNLEKSVDDAGLKKMFEEFGVVNSAVVMKDEETGASKAFGFVDFAEHEAAALAVEKLHEKPNPDNTLLFVSRAQKKGEREQDLREKFEEMKIMRQSKYQGTNLYIKNLDDNIDLERLRKEFDPFGTITSAKIAMSEDKTTSRGFGFVCYSSPEEATKAVNEMHGRIIEKKPLYVGIAESKEQRKSKLEQERASLKHTPVPMNNMMVAGQMYPGMQASQMYMGNMRTPMMGQIPMGAPMRGPAQQPPRSWGMQASQQQQQQYRGQPNMQMQQRAGNARAGQRGPRQGVPAPQAQQGQRQQAGASRAPQIPQQIPQQKVSTNEINREAVMEMPPAAQKNYLGEQLYHQIASIYPENAPKITGMLLEMDANSLVTLLMGSRDGQIGDDLKAKVAEAKNVLDEHEKSQQAQAQE